jgi:hypothetical protein
VVVPGSPQAPSASASSATPATASTQNVAPQQTVPTKEELAPTKPPVEIVQVGGSTPPVTPAKPQAETPATPTQEQNVASNENSSTPPPTAHPAPKGTGPGSIASVAHSMGEDIISLEAPRSDTSAQQPPQTQKPTIVASMPAGSRQYKAEAGDSLSRMASRLMGGNTQANRDALIAANPTLQKNPDLVVSGRTYVIPGGSAPTQSQPSQQQPAPQPAKPQAPEQPTQIASATPQYFYTVKAGDSLTKIAVMQLGNADAVPAIMDLNRDALKGRDIIRPNMKLKLPAKPLASAAE